MEVGKCQNLSTCYVHFSCTYVQNPYKQRGCIWNSQYLEPNQSVFIYLNIESTYYYLICIYNIQVHKYFILKLCKSTNLKSTTGTPQTILKLGGVCVGVYSMYFVCVSSPKGTADFFPFCTVEFYGSLTVMHNWLKI